MIVLYGLKVSSFCRKIRVVLERKGLPYELEEVLPINMADEYRVMSPLGKIPFIKDGDVTLADSSVIVQYLEAQYLGDSLIPDEPKYLAQTLWYEEYADTKCASVLSGLFFEKIMKESFTGVPCDSVAVEALEAQVPEIFDYLDKELVGKTYLVDEVLTLADVAIICQLVNYLNAGYEIDDQRWVNLAVYVGHVLRIEFIHRIVSEAD